MGDDVGRFNIGAYRQGIMAGKTPSLHKLASEGVIITTITPKRALRRAGRTRRFPFAMSGTRLLAGICRDLYLGADRALEPYYRRITCLERDCRSRIARHTSMRTLNALGVAQSC